MGSLSAFGGGLIGYVVPFLFVLTIVVFFHELGHFLMARWCGDQGARIFDRLRPRNRRLQRPLRHALENFRDPARRLREVFRRRQRGERAGSDCRGGNDRGRARKTVSCSSRCGSRAAVVAAGPIANFMLAIAIFAVIFMTVGKQTTSARVDTVQPASAAAGRRLPARRSRDRRSTARRSTASPTCSASSASAPARR